MSFTVPGTPKAQPRGRACVRGKHAAIYDPGTAGGWKALIAHEARQDPYFPRTPFTGPVRCDVTFYMPRPKRLYRKKDPDGPVWHTAKPDRDNLDKAVLDALTQAGVWRDDAQVCSGRIQKVYHEKGGSPRAEIIINPLVMYDTRKEA